MKSFSHSWSARSSPRSPPRLRLPSRSRRRATTRSAPSAGERWLSWSRSRQRAVEPVRPLRPARQRPRLQGQPQGHPGLRRRDRRDEAPLPADPRPVREPVRPQALRPPDEAAEVAPQGSQHEELGVLRDDLGRLDPLQQRALLRPRNAEDLPPEPRHRRAAGGRPPAQPRRRPQCRAGQRELRGVGPLRPVPAMRHLPVRPDDGFGDGARHSPGEGGLQPVGQPVRNGLLRAEHEGLRQVGGAHEAEPDRRARGSGLVAAGARRGHHVRDRGATESAAGDRPDARPLRHRPLQEADVGHLPRRRPRPASAAVP